MITRADIKTLGKPLFERLYMVGIRYKDTRSIEEIRHFGMPTVGVASIDAQMHNDMIDTYITINKMVEYFEQGISFFVRNPAETEEIYQVIHAYLLAWKQMLGESVNAGNVPVQDLVNLDRLAAKIYDHAVEHFPANEPWVSSAMQDLLKSGTGRDGLSSGKKPPPVQVIKPEDLKKHDSLSELFSKATYNRRTY
jgi:hypothetical protein